MFSVTDFTVAGIEGKVSKSGGQDFRKSVNAFLVS
jgi:hypothetical protein